MPNKYRISEIWQRIISYCNDPTELALCNKFMYKTSRLPATIAMWIENHTNSSIIPKLITDSVLVLLLKHQRFQFLDCIQLSFKDSWHYINHNITATEQYLVNCVEKDDSELFSKLLDSFSSDHRLHIILCLTTVLISKPEKISFKYLDILSKWSNNEFDAKVVQLALKGNNISLARHILEKTTLVKIQLDWYTIKKGIFMEILELMYDLGKLDISSTLVNTDLIEIIIARDLGPCLEYLISKGLSLQDNWQLRLAILKNSVDCVSALLKQGMDPHVDHDAAMLDAASLGYTRIVHLLSKHCSNDLLQEALYHAIQGDQPEVVALLLQMPNTPVKADSKSIQLASQRNGQNRQADTHLLVIEILVLKNDEAHYASMVGKNAVQMVSEYCKRVMQEVITK